MKHARAPSSLKKSHKRAHLLPMNAAGTMPQSFADASLDAWLASGNCALTLRSYRRAVLCFEQAFKYDVLHPMAVCGMAKALRSSDADSSNIPGAIHAVEALENIISLSKVDPANRRDTDVEVYHELGECYLAFGKIIDAQVLATEAIARFPDCPKLYLLKATALSLHHDATSPQVLSQMISTLKLCIQSLPSHSQDFKSPDLEVAKQAYIQLANYESQSHDPVDAAKWLESALSLPWSLVEHRQHASTWCGLASLHQTAGNLETAKEVCVAGRNALQISCPLLVTYQAYISIMMGYQDRTQVDPEHKNPTPAETALRAHEAIDTLAHIVDFEHELLYSEAGCYVDDGDFLPWLLLGKAYEMLGEYRHAYTMYHIANKRKQGNQLTWLAIGKMYMEIGQLLDSETAYSKALDHFHPEDHMCLATAWDGLTCVYERLVKQDVNSAESWYSKLLEACTRAVESYTAIGDRANQAFFTNRRAQLLEAHPDKRSDHIPLPRSPPDLPFPLLRRIVIMHPELRLPFLPRQLLAKNANFEHSPRPMLVEKKVPATVASGSDVTHHPPTSTGTPVPITKPANAVGPFQLPGQLTPRQSSSIRGGMLPSNEPQRPQPLARPVGVASNSTAQLGAGTLPELIKNPSYSQHPDPAGAHPHPQYHVVAYPPYPPGQLSPSGHSQSYFPQPGMMPAPMNHGHMVGNMTPTTPQQHFGYAANGPEIYAHPNANVKPVYGPQVPQPGYAYYPQPGSAYSAPQMPYQYPAWYR